jgi:hypothetical protein
MGGAQAPKLPAQAADELYNLVVSLRPQAGEFWTAQAQRDW